MKKTMFTVYLHSSIRLDNWGNLLSVHKERPVILFKGAEAGPVSRAIARAAGTDAGIKSLVDGVSFFFFPTVTFVTPNGWMNGEVFLKTMQEFVIKKQTLIVVDVFAAHRSALGLLSAFLQFRHLQRPNCVGLFQGERD